MSISQSVPFPTRWLAALWLTFGIAGAFGAAPLAPSILTTRTSGNSLLVTASVPRGWRAVVLESRAVTNAGAWVPRAVVRSGLNSGRVTIAVPAFLKGQSLRVRGQLQELLPPSFFQGRHSFAARKSSSWRPDQGRGEVFSLSADGSLPATAAAPAVATTTRTVVESDIWKLDGDTLYYFNQLRGLQIIDLSNPDAPSVRGTLPMPAVGEQMYLLDPQHVVLLARNSCGGDWQSQIVLVDVSGSTPQTVAVLPVTGWLQESRLVGTALYVASQDYRIASRTHADTWQYGTVVSAFDLANPSAPVARPTLWYPGYANAILATDRWLFVTTLDYASGAQPLVRVIDISAPDGTLRDVAGIPTAGQVTDKFKMNLAGDVFTAISQTYKAGSNHDWTGTWITTLQTFSLANPRTPAPLGSLELARGDSLFATRFDGTRAYVVTFHQVDPLWVVDLSNPAQPVVAGAVDVPGWSTYILPLGDQLLTLGVETNRVAVSLFNVNDPANPALLSRVPLGENYSWSEASYDEKALTVLADLGLILVPYTGDAANGWAKRVQLIDLGPSTLTARGIIEHRFAPRRAAAHRSRVISFSSEELLSVDATDRDHPLVKADAEIAWPVNQLFVQGDYLIEIANGGGWLGGDPPAVRVGPTSLPDAIAHRLDLDNLPVVGTALRDSRLYLLQSPTAYYGWPVYGGPIALTASTLSGPDVIAPTNLLMTVVDVSALPAMTIVGQTVVSPGDSARAGANYQAVWPLPGLLVWFSAGSGFWINPMVDCLSSGVLPTTGATVSLPSSALGRASAVNLTPQPVTGSASLPTAGLGAASSMPPSVQMAIANPSSAAQAALSSTSGAQAFLCLPYWRPWWNFGGVSLLAFNVSNPALPALVSTFNFTPTNAWGFSAPQTASGRIYFSHEQSSFLSAAAGWRVSDYLDVIDYADPAAPTLRPAVGIPGQLAGLSADGALLYLLGTAMSAAGTYYLNNNEGLNACAYDGVGAYLVDSLPLPQTWPRPVLVNADTVYLGRAAAAGRTNHTLEAWGLSAQGQFARRALARVALPVTALAAFGPLLAAQSANNAVSLFDLTSPATLRLCGQGAPSGCLWFDLNHAGGALTSGLWLSLDDYGIAAVPLNPAR